MKYDITSFAKFTFIASYCQSEEDSFTECGLKTCLPCLLKNVQGGWMWY